MPKNNKKNSKNRRNKKNRKSKETPALTKVSTALRAAGWKGNALALQRGTYGIMLIVGAQDKWTMWDNSIPKTYAQHFHSIDGTKGGEYVVQKAEEWIALQNRFVIEDMCMDMIHILAELGARREDAEYEGTQLGQVVQNKPQNVAVLPYAKDLTDLLLERGWMQYGPARITQDGYTALVEYKHLFTEINETHPSPSAAVSVINRSYKTEDKTTPKPVVFKLPATSATVYLGKVYDYLRIETNLPHPMAGIDGNAKDRTVRFKIKTQIGAGVAYAEKHFGITPNVTDLVKSGESEKA